MFVEIGVPVGTPINSITPNSWRKTIAFVASSRKSYRYASVPRIVIERASTRTRVTIWTARPGIVIGRKGQELDSLRDSLNRTVGKEVRLEIQEIKKPDLVASLVAKVLPCNLRGGGLHSAEL